MLYKIRTQAARGTYTSKKQRALANAKARLHDLPTSEKRTTIGTIDDTSTTVALFAIGGCLPVRVALCTMITHLKIRK